MARTRLVLHLVLALVVAMPALARADTEATSTILFVAFRGCEELCQGFKDRIAASGFDAEVVVHDVAQDKTRLPGAVAEARRIDADLIVTWGTSVTLGIAGTLDETDTSHLVNDIPIVFTIVADPFGTRIADSFDGSGRPHVTGTFNRVPEVVNLKIIQQYDSEFGKLGLLYNTNERNSLIKKEELEALAPQLGIELVALEIDPGNPGKPDVAALPERIAELAARGVRWVYLGSSSFLLQEGEAFTHAAVENGIGVVSPYEELVRNQKALLSIAARVTDIGGLAADQALRILRDGATPGDLPIVRATDFAYVVNMEVARALGRMPPFAFLQVAETTSP